MELYSSWPPHTSHKLQPLHRCVCLDPLRVFTMKRVITLWWVIQENQLDFTIFLNSLGKSYPRAFTPINNQKGFIKSKQEIIKVWYLSSQKIKDRTKENEACWSLVKAAIPGTRDIHYLNVPDLVKIKLFSNSNEFQIYDLKKGDFIPTEIVVANDNYAVGYL